LAIVNLVVVLGTIAWNYGANAIGVAGNTVGSLSDQYNALFTPAGYAFSIWGLIFLGLVANGVYLAWSAFSQAPGGGASSDTILRMVPPLVVANLANCAWIWLWLTERTGLSLVAMAVILFSLGVVIVRLDIARWNAPMATIAWLWWPAAIYAGWIVVASIANAAAYLSKVGWLHESNEVGWTVAMIVLATVVDLTMVLWRNLREVAGVGIWALVAISVRHAGEIPTIAVAAGIGAGVLALVVVAHAYQNRATLPGVGRPGRP
ncbi:MAG: hypothetical protein KC416_08545, partial [Myxococcales bacterium]|nr:hypothetical protein [Myxococcales bacterium]